MAQAMEYATRQELEDVKTELNRFSVALAVLSERMDRQFEAVDARFEAVDARFDAMDSRFDAIDARLEKLTTEFTKLVNDGNAAIMSALMTLGKR